jgi:hypothetical protein
MSDVIFISVLAGSISFTINVLFWNIRRMRCIHYKDCCCECDRVIMTENELKMDTPVNSFTLP